MRFDRGEVQTGSLPAGAFDATISRFGTMFFSDPIGAFANIGSSLRAGARLCIASWQPLLANDWLTVPGGVPLRYGTVPDAPAGPGMFAQSDPEELTATVSAAGFDDVEVTLVATTVTLGADPAAAADYLAGTGPGRAVMDTVADGLRPVALEAVAGVLAELFGPGGVQLGAAVWLTTAAWRR